MHVWSFVQTNRSSPGFVALHSSSSCTRPAGPRRRARRDRHLLGNPRLDTSQRGLDDVAVVVVARRSHAGQIPASRLRGRYRRARRRRPRCRPRFRSGRIGRAVARALRALAQLLVRQHTAGRREHEEQQRFDDSFVHHDRTFPSTCRFIAGRTLRGDARGTATTSAPEASCAPRRGPASSDPLRTA